MYLPLPPILISVYLPLLPCGRCLYPLTPYLDTCPRDTCPRDTCPALPLYPTPKPLSLPLPLQDPEYLDLRNTCCLAWSLGRLRVYPPCLFGRLVDSCMQQQEVLLRLPKDLTRFLWAVGSLGHYDEKMLHDVTQGGAGRGGGAEGGQGEGQGRGQGLRRSRGRGGAGAEEGAGAEAGQGQRWELGQRRYPAACPVIHVGYPPTQSAPWTMGAPNQTGITNTHLPPSPPASQKLSQYCIILLINIAPLQKQSMKTMTRFL